MIYTLVPRAVGALVLATTIAALSGCNTSSTKDSNVNSATANKRGVVAGQVLLSAPDEVTSHSGVVVYLAGTSHQARTNAGGNYRIESIPAGHYEIMAEKPGYQTALVDNMEIDPSKHTIDQPAAARVAILELSGAQTTGTAADRLGSVQGLVYLQGQERSAGVRVQLDGTQFVTVSNDDGSYRLLNVLPGTYSLTFTHPDFKPYTATPVTVLEGNATTVAEAALERTQQAVLIGTPSVDLTTVAAAATPVGTPIVGSQLSGDRVITGIVQLTDLQNQPVTDFTRAVVAINDSDIVANLDEEGRFRIGNLAPGVYTLIGTLDNGEATRVPVDLTTQQTATVILKISAVAAPKPMGDIVGRVILPGPDDLPMSDASGVRVGIAGTQAAAVTAKDGTFKLEQVPEGSHALIASKDGFEDYRQDGVAVSAGAPADIGEITLEPKRDYPRVIGTVPPAGTRNVPVGLDIVLQVKFSKPMDPATLRAATSVQPPTASEIFIGRGSHPLATDESMVVVLSSLSQNAPIRFQTNYQLAIAKSATDLDGLGMREDFSLNFSTGAAGLIMTRPANGEQNVFVDQNYMPVILNFNTRIRPDSLSERNIRVRPDNGISVSVTHTEDPRTGWTNVRVATQWQPDTNYTITIGREVRAANGQTLGNTPYTLRFRTAALEVIQAPIQVVR